MWPDAVPLPATSFDPSTYETHMIDLDTPAGQALATHMSDGWATRYAVLLSLFEPQLNGAWCALASAVIGLRSVGVEAVPTQQQLYERFILTRAGGMSNGVRTACPPNVVNGRA
jgi:hypothetical protein